MPLLKSCASPANSKRLRISWSQPLRDSCFALRSSLEKPNSFWLPQAKNIIIIISIIISIVIITTTITITIMICIIISINSIIIFRPPPRREARAPRGPPAGADGRGPEGEVQGLPTFVVIIVVIVVILVIVVIVVIVIIVVVIIIMIIVFTHTVRG